MRHIFTIFLLLLGQFLFCQVGQQAAQIAIDIGSSTLPETETLVSINLHQQQVLDYSQEIANKTAAIAVLKEAELAALDTTPEDFQETTPWRASVASIDAIVRLNTNTLQLLNDFPDVTELPITVTAVILEKAYAGFSDIEAVLSDGNDNLMYATDRFTLVEKLNVYLDELQTVSRVLNIVVRNMVIASGELTTDYTYDITETMNNMLEQIDNLIIE